MRSTRARPLRSKGNAQLLQQAMNLPHQPSPEQAVEQFIAKSRKRQSKLDPWADEIYKLLDANVSYREICLFLAQNGKKAHPSEIYKFVRAKKRAEQFQKPLLNRIKSHPVMETAGDQSAIRDIPPPSQPQDIKQATSPPEKKPLVEKKPGELPKFTWDVADKPTDNW